MTKTGRHLLAENNYTTRELREAILGILDSGDEYSAYGIMKVLEARGKHIQLLRIPQTINGMEEVTKRRLTDCVGSRLHYLYRRKWLKI